MVQLPLFERGFLNELDLQRIFNVLGNYYFKFRERMGTNAESNNLDKFPAKVFHGGVRGLFTIMEGIIMYALDGGIWVAYLDVDNIKYFTNKKEWKTNLPKTIENWRSRFPDISIKLVQDIDYSPNILPAD